MTHCPAAIVVVTYNSGAFIGSCLESTRQTGAEVIVIDNASSDATVAIAEGLGFRVIANRENRGFAAAVNQGVRATTAPFVLLLNPDAKLNTGIDAMVARCANREIGAVAGRLISLDGSPQTGFNIRRFPTPLVFIFESLLINRLWPGNPVNWYYRCLDKRLDQPAQVEQPAGAFLLFSRRAWEQIGGMDEGFYPLWFEDVDFCKRMSNAGFQIFYEPAATAVHHGAHSIAHIRSGTRTEYWYRSLLRYSILHFTPGGRLVTCLGVATGSVLRSLLAGCGQCAGDAKFWRCHCTRVSLHVDPCR